MRSVSSKAVKAALLTLCAAAGIAGCVAAHAAQGEPPHPQAIDDAIIAASKRHGVPEHLIRRIIMRESKYNARARNRLYWGLMQISYSTAKSMGFKGTREQLLDPMVNLRYAVPYLANAYRIAGKTEDAAVRLYAAGYYFTARSRGMLDVLRTAESPALSGVPDDPQPQPVLAANANAQPPQSVGIFGALFGPGQQPQAQTQMASAVPADAYSASAAGQPPVAAQPVVVQASAAQPATAPAGTFDGKPVDMVVGKDGNAAPPKKWQRDGGTTLIARGEQPLERSQTADATPSRGRHAKKITLAAALDIPTSTAQAYAGAQDSRFAGVSSQAAIVQATSGQPTSGQTTLGQATSGQAASGQPTSGQPDPSQPPAAADPVPTLHAVDETPAKRKRTRHVKRTKPAPERTQQAAVEPPPAEAPALRPTAQ